MDTARRFFSKSSQDFNEDLYWSDGRQREYVFDPLPPNVTKYAALRDLMIAFGCIAAFAGVINLVDPKTMNPAASLIG